MAPRYRLPLLVLEATAMRISELELLRWGDVDETAGRWRVTQAVAKTRRARRVQVPSDLFAALLTLMPREDGEPDARVFPYVEQARLRTELGRRAARSGRRGSDCTISAIGGSPSGTARASRSARSPSALVTHAPG